MITKLVYKEIEKNIISNLVNANKSVEIAVAWFTNPSLYNVLIELISRSVSIKIILCDDSINFCNTKVDFQKLIDLGAKIQISRSPKLMHNKFCIIDNRKLITGSYNWTLRAEKLNYENVIISTDKHLINEFEEYLEYLSENTKQITNVSSSNFNTVLSEKEIVLELQLEESKVDLNFIFAKEELQQNSPEIQSDIDSAELLYLGQKHKECILLCREMIKKHPHIAEFHLILASSYWRLNETGKLVESAISAIEIDNEIYDAYNLLGIGYARIKGKEQLSVKNYNICLSEFPDDHAFLRNRALSFIALEIDSNLPKRLRDNFQQKADVDLKRIINILDEIDEDQLNYSELHSKAVAYTQLNKLALAKKNIDLALKVYNEVGNPLFIDKNELMEMKYLQKDLVREMKKK